MDVDVEDELPGKRNSRQTIRASISEFARTGSQVSYNDIDDATEDLSRDDIDLLEPNDHDTHSDMDEEKSTHIEVEEEDQAPNITDSQQSSPAGVSEVARPGSQMSHIEEDDATITEEETMSSQDIIDLTELDDDDAPSIVPSTSSYHVVSRPEVIRSTNAEDGISLRFDITRLAEKWARLREKTKQARHIDTAPNRVPVEASVSNTDDDRTAVDALARVIEKEDFGSMEIIGQFNLGFIVTRRRKYESEATTEDPEMPVSRFMDDLFIVDQHAADEKYNFESLQQTTVIQSQKLLRPRPLELTAADELLALEHIDVLRKNGFELDVVDTSRDSNTNPGARLQLVAQPISKGTVFDMKDLEELIHLMEDLPVGQMVRCSKARAMFAMRACRKSVMVGMPLTQKQMTAVVHHMGTMDQPWNCPHGRPTMRHLFDISNSIESYGLHLRPTNWAAFASAGMI